MKFKDQHCISESDEFILKNLNADDDSKTLTKINTETDSAEDLSPKNQSRRASTSFVKKRDIKTIFSLENKNANQSYQHMQAYDELRLEERIIKSRKMLP